MSANSASIQGRGLEGQGQEQSQRSVCTGPATLRFSATTAKSHCVCAFVCHGPLCSSAHMHTGPALPGSTLEDQGLQVHGYDPSHCPSCRCSAQDESEPGPQSTSGGDASQPALPEAGGSCIWESHPKFYSTWYAGNDQKLYDLAGAKARCLAQGSQVCKAVSCTGSSGAFCTVRASATLTPSPEVQDETTFTAAAECYNDPPPSAPPPAAAAPAPAPPATPLDDDAGLFFGKGRSRGCPRDALEERLHELSEHIPTVWPPGEHRVDSWSCRATHAQASHTNVRVDFNASVCAASCSATPLPRCGFRRITESELIGLLQGLHIMFWGDSTVGLMANHLQQLLFQHAPKHLSGMSAHGDALLRCSAVLGGSASAASPDAVTAVCGNDVQAAKRGHAAAGADSQSYGTWCDCENDLVCTIRSGCGEFAVVGGANVSLSRRAGITTETDVVVINSQGLWALRMEATWDDAVVKMKATVHSQLAVMCSSAHHALVLWTLTNAVVQQLRHHF